MVLFMVLMLLVPSATAYAEVAGINKDNFVENYRYSVLRFNRQYTVVEYEDETTEVSTTYIVNPTVFYIGNGYFATASHCVVSEVGIETKDNEYWATIVRKKNGKLEELERYDLELVANDRTTDTAILKAKKGVDVSKLVAIPITADFDDEEFKTAFSIGWPGGNSYEYKEYYVTYREGVLSGGPVYNQYVSNSYRMDGGAIGGQSGSPVINDKKELIGILYCANDTNAWATSAEALLDMLKKTGDEKAIALIPKVDDSVSTVSNQN